MGHVMLLALVLVENGWWNESGFGGMRDNGRAKQMRHKHMHASHSFINFQPKYQLIHHLQQQQQLYFSISLNKCYPKPLLLYHHSFTHQHFVVKFHPFLNQTNNISTTKSTNPSNSSNSSNSTNNISPFQLIFQQHTFL